MFNGEMGQYSGFTFIRCELTSVTRGRKQRKLKHWATFNTSRVTGEPPELISTAVKAARGISWRRFKKTLPGVRRLDKKLAEAN
jgi:hypothetical protein